jgi:hypothetical protein
VYCHYNLRLAKKIEQPEKFAEWHGGEEWTFREPSLVTAEQSSNSDLSYMH